MPEMRSSSSRPAIQGIKTPIQSQEFTSGEGTTGMTCISMVYDGMWQDPSGAGQVSCTSGHQSRAKGMGSMTVLAHQFPPPSSSGHLILAKWAGHLVHDVLELKFISRLGDCSTGPQCLIYICT